MPPDFTGLVLGTVLDLEDPEALSRVRVRFLEGPDELSGWARLVSVGAGADRGLHVVPEVGDTVVVGFEGGDPRRPLVLGGLWSRADPPPIDDGDPAANNWRVIRSRSGHTVRFDDTRGAERVELEDKSEDLRVVLDSAARAIHVKADSGDITVEARNGTVTLRAARGIKIESEYAVELSGNSLSLAAHGNCSIEAAGKLSLKGAVIEIN